MTPIALIIISTDISETELSHCPTKFDERLVDRSSRGLRRWAVSIGVYGYNTPMMTEYFSWMTVLVAT